MHPILARSVKPKISNAMRYEALLAMQNIRASLLSAARLAGSVFAELEMDASGKFIAEEAHMNSIAILLEHAEANCEKLLDTLFEPYKQKDDTHD